MDEEELNAKLMLTLMKKLTPRVYIALRKALVDQGLEDAIIINALIAEMDYISDFYNGATLVIDASDPEDISAHVREGALVTPLLSDDASSERADGL